jgi:hypothetical protein
MKKHFWKSSVLISCLFTWNEISVVTSWIHARSVGTGEGNLTNIMRRNVNIRKNCLVCGEVMSLKNPLEHVIVLAVMYMYIYHLMTLHFLNSIWNPHEPTFLCKPWKFYPTKISDFSIYFWPLRQWQTSINCNGDRYRCSPNVPHLVSGVIIVYVINTTTLLQ